VIKREARKHRLNGGQLQGGGSRKPRSQRDAMGSGCVDGNMGASAVREESGEESVKRPFRGPMVEPERDVYSVVDGAAGEGAVEW
jgi:hypothetical protein